jgi:hypothetical protein
MLAGLSLVLAVLATGWHLAGWPGMLVGAALVCWMARS